MELSWSTILLEIINFLVLLWVLKRFLYQPILAMIARRQASIAQSIAEGKQLHTAAESLQAQYQNRLDDWQQEREKMRATLQQEIVEERAHQLQLLQDQLAQEREKSRVIAERTLQEALRNLEQTAVQQYAQFATCLLKPLANASLERSIVELLIAELSALDVPRRESLRAALNETPTLVNVSSAYPLDDQQRVQLEHLLHELIAVVVPVHYRQDADLLAGLRIVIGPWLLGANLRDELKAFTEYGIHGIHRR